MPGVIFVETGRHGGYHLSPAVNERIPAPVRQANGYDGQDIEAALCVSFVPFPGPDPTEVQVVLETWFPEIYAGIVRGDFRR